MKNWKEGGKDQDSEAKDADEKSDLSVTMDFDGECWDVWFPNPLGGRQVGGAGGVYAHPLGSS